MSVVENLLEQIENCKEKLSSEEYKNMMETLDILNTEQKKSGMYRFTIIVPLVNFREDDNWMIVNRDVDSIVIEQNEIRCDMSQYRGYETIFDNCQNDLTKVSLDFVNKLLTDENRHNLSAISKVDMIGDFFEDQEHLDFSADMANSYFLKIEKI